MSANPTGHPEEGPTAWIHAVRVVNPDHFDPNTPQTSGMHRVAAVSPATVGSKGIWAGITDVTAHAATGTHHHGEQETVIYVVSGHVRMRWGDRLEYEADAGTGNFIYVSPFVPHQEINPARRGLEVGHRAQRSRPDRRQSRVYRRNPTGGHQPHSPRRTRPQPTLGPLRRSRVSAVPSAPR